MNQMSRDVQQSLVHLHLVHTQNNIYPLAFQDNMTGREHSPDKLQWDFTDNLIETTQPSGVLIEYDTLVAQSDNLAFFA
jgi:hypothetical protein